MVEPASSLILYSLILIASYTVFNIWVRWVLKSLSKRRMKISYPKWGKAIAGIYIALFTIWCIVCTAALHNAPTASSAIVTGIAVVFTLFFILTLIADASSEDKDTAKEVLNVQERLVSFTVLAVLFSGVCVAFVLGNPDYSEAKLTPEYTVNTDGTRTPKSTRIPLAPQDNGTYVTATTVEHKINQYTSELRTVNTWLEKDNGTIRTVSKYTEQEHVTISEDVPAGETAYAEHIPLYYMAPNSAFDAATANPVEGTICVQGRDENCKPNAVQVGEQIIIHVPAGGGTKTNVTNQTNNHVKE